MVDSERLSSNFCLTKVEACQVANRADTPLDKLALYVEYYRSHAEERARILTNPFSAEVGKQISQIFGNSDSRWDILRAAIIAEPDGDYDQNYKRANWKDKHEMLINQIESSAHMTIRIQRYIEDNLSSIDNISDEELYKKLCRVAFDSEDETAIQAQYARSQRRGFRLSIVNFLEDRNRLLPYKLEASADPKAFSEKYLEKKFTGNVGIENLPIGIVIYLDEQDYALIDSIDGDLHNIISEGLILNNLGNLELNNRIIVINKGGEKSGLGTPNKLSIIKGHEIRHILFLFFHGQQVENMEARSFEESLLRCNTEEDYLKLSEAMCGYFSEMARDEIIAYLFEGVLNTTYSELGFDEYKLYLEETLYVLKNKRGLESKTKLRIANSFIQHYMSCFETTKRIRAVARQMFIRSELSHEMVEVLLRNTASAKIIRRLPRYAGLDEAKIDEVITETDRKADDQRYYEDSLLAIKQLTKQLLVEPLPVISVIWETVAKWSKATLTSFLIPKFWDKWRL